MLNVPFFSKKGWKQIFTRAYWLFLLDDDGLKVSNWKEIQSFFFLLFILSIKQIVFQKQPKYTGFSNARNCRIREVEASKESRITKKIYKKFGTYPRFYYIVFRVLLLRIPNFTIPDLLQRSAFRFLPFLVMLTALIVWNN